MQAIYKELEKFNVFNDKEDITTFLKTLPQEVLAAFACNEFIRAEMLDFYNYSDL